ncbi:MAG: thioredoxin domain-containing protein [Planctomycetota bacterium]|nr:thioredoxin domain-containing protein [Planctomycetota bacterium]
MGEQRHGNLLARERSPYLLQHAHNPVEWHPWGPVAFEKARSLGRPIFLSIGYSTCHWCHVMERESFEDEATAAVMNQLFVNIKVDREERPDVDQVYMQAVMAMTGQGGWPLSVWLTPDLKPFYGGTYFPPTAQWGRPGFADVLRGIAESWDGRRQDVQANVGRLMGALEGRASDAGDVSSGLSDQAARDLEAAFDSRWGGFGSAPKFPRPAALAFLAHRCARTAWDAGKSMLETTLEMMWRGGMYDHVGGGFSRYSTDDKWLVPHFEKMLYDNALLVDSYLDGHLLCGRADFADVARDVLEWVAREMTHEEGGFFCAQDADSEGVEGKFYVFDGAEVDRVIGDDAALFRRVFSVTDGGNFEGHNILWFQRSVAEVAASEGMPEAELRGRCASWRKVLYDYREQRIRPGLDDKVLTSWNGLMISACARAGAVLGEPRWIEAAERAALFIKEHMRDENGVLLRRWRDGEARYEASLDDHAAYANGLLALFEATGRACWLAEANELADEIEDRYADASGGYWFAPQRDDLIVRMKDSYDGALPSGNSLTALLLARLGAALDREELRERSLRTVRAFAATLGRVPESAPLLLCAMVEATEPPRTLFVVGDGSDPSFGEELGRAHRALMPGRVIIPVTDRERSAIDALGVPLHDKSAPAGATAAYLCEDAACRPW